MTTPYLRNYYAGGGTSTTLANAMGEFDGSFVITADTGWPGGAGFFTVVVDRGTSSEEKIRCASNSGTTVTVASDGNGGRGYDGTSATGHNAGATVSLCGTSVDFDQANQVVTQVLGQSGAAKGDILAMLSAAGPNTLTRVGIGSTRNLLSVAAGLPAWAVGLLVPTVQAGAYNAADKDFVSISGGNVATLPTASAGLMVGVYASDANAANGVTAAGSDKIYGLGLASGGVAAGTLVPTAAVGSYLILIAEAALKWRVVAGVQDSGWVTVANGSMSNSWVNGTIPFGYRLMGNTVRFRGALNGSNAGTILTLPAGFRPAQAFGGMILFQLTSTTDAFSCSISTGGVITAAGSGFSGDFTMNNYSFTVD